MPSVAETIIQVAMPLALQLFPQIPMIENGIKELLAAGATPDQVKAQLQLSYNNIVAGWADVEATAKQIPDAPKTGA